MSDFEVSAADTAAKSDQLNADDLIAGPLVGTITRITRGTDEQPWNIHLDTWPRPWRPSKGQRRVLLEVLGIDHTKWIGRKVELYRDPTVKWGGVEVGGIKLGATDAIPTQRAVAVTVAKGKKAQQVVGVLARTSKAPSLDAVAQRLKDRGLWDAALDKFTDNMDAWVLDDVIAWARGQA